MRRKFFVLAAIFLALIPREVFAIAAMGPGAGEAIRNAADCLTVEVDCRAHTVKMQGLVIGQRGPCGDESKINCGRTTKNGTGRIGGKHRGPIVPNGVRIEGIRGMGDSGGGRVFHTPNPRNENSCPRGVDNTKGCITVSKTVMERLRRCGGVPLKITNAKGGGGGNNSRGPASTVSQNRRAQ